MRKIILLFMVLFFISAFIVTQGQCFSTQDQTKPKAPNRQNNVYFKFAQSAANWLKSMAVEESPGAYKWPVAEEQSFLYRIGMDDGTTGAGIFFLELYKVTKDPQYLKYAKGAASHLSQHSYQQGEIDWLSGAAGVGCFFIDLWEVTHDTSYLAQAQRAGNYLISKHYQENGGYYWRHSQDLPKIYTSFAHGAAGIGYFFARLYDETKDEKYLNYAEGAATWIFSYMWEPTPGLYCWPRLTTDTEANTTWCGGSVGIIIFLLKLYDVTGDNSYFNYAQGGIDWLIAHAHAGGNGSYKWGYGANDAESNSFAYCHGTPSVVHLLYEMYNRTNDQQYINFARGGAKWLSLEAEIVSKNIFRWPHLKGWCHDTGLLTGTAGVGNSFVLYYPYDKNASYLKFARGAAHWLMSVAEYYSFTKVKWINYVDAYNSDYGDKQHEPGWYYGAAGIGLFFLHVSEILPKPEDTNQPPVLNEIGHKEISVNQTLQFDLSGYDADNDLLVYIAGNVPDGAKLAGKHFSWTPKNDQTGAHSIYFIVTDGWYADWERVNIKVSSF
jgi:rhamnogalacturonyl hydrolase YesR